MGRNFHKWLLLAGLFLLGLVITLSVAFCFGRPLHCLLWYRITDVHAAVIFTLITAEVAILKLLFTPSVRSLSQGILGFFSGVVVGLLICAGVSVCSPPLEEECFPTPIVTVVPTSTRTPPKPTPPTRVVRPTSILTEVYTDTPSPTVSQTPTPTLHPPVTLIAPEEDACVDCGTPVTLRWSWPHGLEADECYRSRLWGAEQTSNLFSLMTTEDQFDLSTSDYPPGAYNWAVAVVNSMTGGVVSKECEPRHFHIALSPPVVRGILPTSTFSGRPVQVSISGENFTQTVALTIGMPLSFTLVDSAMITTTIPITLQVGQYPVIVQDQYGRGTSSVSFAVRWQQVTTTTTTPQSPTHPAPELKENGIIGRNVTFRWEWAGTLAEDEWFAVRVGKLPDIPHSQKWVKEREFMFSLCTLGGDAGRYVWEIAVCQAIYGTDHCSALDRSQLAVSDRWEFEFGGCLCDE